MTESEPSAARRGIVAARQRASMGSTGAAKDASVTRRSSPSATPSPSSPSATDRTRREGRNGSGSSAATKTQPAATGAPRRTVRKPRRAQLRLSQVDAWSVTKTAFLLSIALGIVTVVAVGIVWVVLGAAGVFDSLNSTVQTVMGNDFRVQDYIGTGRVLGFTMLLAVVDVFLLTAIATLTAFLYNLAAILLGGVELTLTEDG